MPDLKKCAWSSAHGMHTWTDRLERVNGIPEDTLQYHFCTGVHGTTLDGATNEPAPEVMTGDAGEFAARWNTATPMERERRWQNMQRAFNTASKCLQEDHDSLLDQLRRMGKRRATALSEIQGLLDSLDDHITRDEIYSALKDIQEKL